MFFKLHDENKIGYKTLSDADLGLRKTSHQTHIGLSEHVLTFLPDRDVVSEDSIFIYEDSFEYLDTHFNRIENPNGSFRSPKISIGGKDCISVVSTIREKARTLQQTSWYLIWFGLRNEKIVFFLFNDLSDDYLNLQNMGINLRKKGAKALDAETPMFRNLVIFLERKVNNNGIDILKELEVGSQIQELKPNKRFKKYDIDMANQKFKETGEIGERLVNEYLKCRYQRGELLEYTWLNENGESGLPYDFFFQDRKSNIFYLDVKTTSYDFNQKMIFSKQEIDFISNHEGNYCIYRVYKTEEEKYFLKICNDCKELSTAIWLQTTKCIDELKKIQIELKSAKLAIPPNIPSLKFKTEIDISCLN